MWAILVSGYCSNLYPVLDREAHTMWLSLHFLTMIIGPKRRIINLWLKWKNLCCHYLYNQYFYPKKILNRFHQKMNLPHLMSDQQTSYFQKMRSLQKGRGWGVFDVLLMSTKSMCVFYHQWCIDQRNLHEIQPHLSHGNLNNGKSKTNPPPDKTLGKTLFFMFLFSLFCAEPCFFMFLFSLFCAKPCFFYVFILSFLCRALWCDQTKGRSDLVPQSDVLKLLPLSQVGCLWFVFGLVYWLFVVTLSSWCFLPDWQTLCLLLSFHEQTKLWFMVWFDSFEIFLRVRANEQFSWPIFASPELEFKFYFWSLHYKGILPQKFT